MEYNENVEGVGLANLMDNLFTIKRPDFATRVIKVSVVQPDKDVDTCFSDNVGYYYKIKVFVEAYNPNTNEILDSRTNEIEFSLPKLSNNSFLIQSKNGIAKFKNSIIESVIDKSIFEFGGKLVLRETLEMIPVKYSAKHVLYDYKIKIGETEYSLASILMSAGLDYSYLNQRYYSDSENSPKPVELPKTLIINERVVEKLYFLFSEKFTEITPRLLSISSALLMTDPERYRDISPFDIVPKKEFDTLRTSIMKCKRMIQKNMYYKFKYHNSFYSTDIQNVINKHFNLSFKEGGIQSPYGSNACTSLSQSNKIVIRNKKGEDQGLDYTTSFVGLIDPIKTPEGNHVNLRNEISRSTVIIDQKFYIKVLDPKTLREKLVSFFEFYSSRLLNAESWDYEKKVLRPNSDGLISTLIHGKYEKVPAESSFDFIQVSENSKLSYSTSFIPLVNHSDSVRIQMATSMIDQAIVTRDSVRPVVSTGIETEILKKSGEVIRSKNKGTIKEITPKSIIIQTAEGSDVAAPIPSPKNTPNSTSIFYLPNVKVGDVIEVGHPVVVPDSLRDSGLSITTPVVIAYMNYEGSDYEDGIVMSQSCAEKFSHRMTEEIEILIEPTKTYIFDKSYVSGRTGGTNIDSSYLNAYGLREVGDVIHRGEIFANYIKILKISDDPWQEVSAFLAGKTKEKYYEVETYRVPNQILEGKITSLELSLSDRITNKQDIVNHYSGKPGITIKSLGYDSIKFTVEYWNVPKMGDKFSNRYGSKGTICRLVPDDQMFRTEDGMVIDMVMSPESITNRKNVSQILEIGLGNISKFAYSKALGYIADSNWEALRKLYSVVYQSEFSSMDIDDLKKFHRDNSVNNTYYRIFVQPFSNKYNLLVIRQIKQELGIPLDDKVFLIDPKSGRKIRNPIVVGTTNLMRLHFIVESKARATSELRVRQEFVLGTGKTRESGQKIGNMECWALLANNNKKLFDHLSKNHWEIKKNELARNFLSLGMILEKGPNE